MMDMYSLFLLTYVIAKLSDICAPYYFMLVLNMVTVHQVVVFVCAKNEI